MKTLKKSGEYNRDILQKKIITILKYFDKIIIKNLPSEKIIKNYSNRIETINLLNFKMKYMIYIKF